MQKIPDYEKPISSKGPLKDLYRPSMILYYATGLWILRKIVGMTTDMVKGFVKPGKPRTNFDLSREEILRIYDMTEQDAMRWVEQMRKVQITIFAAIIIMGALNVWMKLAASEPMPFADTTLIVSLFVMGAFFLIALREQWRIEILEGRSRYMSFKDWMKTKVTGGGRKHGQ